MSIDPLLISIVALTVALITLLFGPGIALRVWRARRERLRTRADRERQLFEYLQQAVVFLDGLPLFIEETWSWGPSVPNYAAGGSFPDQSSPITREIPSIRAAVDEALQLYQTHSQKQGLSYDTKDEALQQLAEIQERFWESVEEFAKSEWLLRWRSKTRGLRKLKLPNSEREIILKLKNVRK